MVTEELARGGMGRVLIARDRQLGRQVAIKELLVDDAEMRARFEREATTTARLQHPNIVSVYEQGIRPGGMPFYVMPLIQGRPLDQLIAQRKTVTERLDLLPNVIAVASALAYAHEQGVIHRDLKPGNVMVGQFGETVVIDWGLAKNLAQPSATEGTTRSPQSSSATDQAGSSTPANLTLAGEVLGTPAYMPPEQALGQELDREADVYALGALLWHVLSGEPPYAGATGAALLEVVASRPPAEPDWRGVPDDLVHIARKAMAFWPSLRYHSVREVAEDLQRFTSGHLARSSRSSSNGIQWWRIPAVVALAVSAAAILGAAIWALAHQ